MNELINKTVLASVLQKYDEKKGRVIQKVDALPETAENRLYAMAHTYETEETKTTNALDIIGSYTTMESKGKYKVDDFYTLVLDGYTVGSFFVSGTKINLYTNRNFTGLIAYTLYSSDVKEWTINTTVEHQDFFAGNSEKNSFTKLANVNQVEDFFIRKDQKGSAGGVAILDENGKIPFDELSFNTLIFMGVSSDFASDIAALEEILNGMFFISGTAQTYEGTSYNAGDWIIYDGDKWEKSVNTNLVDSVNGKTGPVELTAEDINISEKDNRTVKELVIDDAGIDWNNVEYLGDGAGGGAYSNKYKAAYIGRNRAVVNIQLDTSNKPSIYITVSAPVTKCDITVDDSGYSMAGAGIWVHLDNFKRKETIFNVFYGADGVDTFAVYFVNGYEENTAYVSQAEERLIENKIAEKQDALVSGTNIKTINNESLLGSGNIPINGAVIDDTQESLTTVFSSTATMNNITTGYIFSGYSSPSGKFRFTADGKVQVKVGTLIKVIVNVNLADSASRVLEISVDNGVNWYPVKSYQNGALKNLPSHKVTISVDGRSANQYWLCRMGTTLELMFDGSAWVVMGNPDVFTYQASDGSVSCSIKSDGLIEQCYYNNSSLSQDASTYFNFPISFSNNGYVCFSQGVFETSNYGYDNLLAKTVNSFAVRTSSRSRPKGATFYAKGY